jgi:hypothetical protein
MSRHAPAALPPTEVAFTLPRGFAAADGSVHRDGAMRLARARDELELMRAPLARDDDAYVTVLLLSRVITRLGDVDVTPEVIEDLYAQDFEHLVRLAQQLNCDEPVGVVTCPHCSGDFEVDLTAVEDRALGK